MVLVANTAKNNMKQTIKTVFISIALIAAFAGASTTTSSAQEKKEAALSTNAVAATKAQSLPFHGTVASVDAIAKSVTLKGDKKQVLLITPQTKIVKGGKVATFESITADLRVQGFKTLNSEGKYEAKTFTIVEAKALPAVIHSNAPALTQ